MHSTDDPIFKFLVEQSPDGQFVVVDGTFVYLNSAAAKMFSFDGSDPTELRVVDVLHPSEHERALRNMALRASGVLRGAAQYLVRRKDGTTFPIEVHAAPLKWDGRSGLHGIIRDIIQNHLMQVISIVCMEPPLTAAGLKGGNKIRDAKVNVVRSMRRIDPKDVVVGQSVTTPP